MLIRATMLLLIMLPLDFGLGQMRPIASTRYDHRVPAKTDAGAGSLTAREMLVDVTFPNGRACRCALLILFDQPTGRYLWEFGQVMANEQTSRMTGGIGGRALIYVAPDRMVGFGYALPSLVIHESLGKASGIDEAEAKTSTEILGRLPAIQAHSTDDRVIIPIRKIVPNEFFFRTPLSPMSIPIKVTDASRKANTWELILQGSWQEKVTLNDKYQVTGTARIN